MRREKVKRKGDGVDEKATDELLGEIVPSEANGSNT